MFKYGNGCSYDYDIHAIAGPYATIDFERINAPQDYKPEER
jgi:hypothetical protein